ncbi:hypothetical protein LYSHEL_03100 [Lysobacter helvus]|uniref:DUF2007 domain-containing protein n=2 Tax=Lysobacteraceae TaxID=32033 RepID=A0ABN6FNZ5_9GAMM|nr:MULTISPECIES: hypothetical protein [Lysobacter]BCT91286.1 hypothetical protein LYSCAS_03100 [Lysobacter caseinilyticus]BCT94439.1 hypothetical protein LYSHEL_03100 [Lysobacter helvus]
MRQVFASARMENVEGIAQFLEEHDIEVRITHGRSYKGGWGGRRTYRDDESGPIPAVWVVKSEDQPRARQLLREAGLLGSTRTGTDSFLAPSVHGDSLEFAAKAAPTKRAFRYKVALLIAIVAAVALAWTATRNAKVSTATPPKLVDGHGLFLPAERTAPATTVTAKPAEPVPGAYPVDTPPVLATTLAATELAIHDTHVACLRIDGVAASDEMLAPLKRTGLAFDCTRTADAATLTLDVRGYRTDGSGTGTVDLAVTSADGQGRASTQVRSLLVRRQEADWHVVRILSVQ